MNYFASGLPLVEWMGSEGGRRFLLSFSGVAGGTIGTLYWLPHSILIDRTKDWLQMYDNAIPVKPHPAVIDLVAEALADCGITESDARACRWFTTFTFDPIHKGQMSFNKGAIIGLPKPFLWKSVEDVERTGIKMYRGKAVPWRSEAGEAFQKALILSEEAKKFAIAREIHATCTSYALAKTFVVAAPIPFLTTIGAFVADWLGLIHLEVRRRVFIYSVWGSFSLILMVTGFDLASRLYEKWEDEETSKLSESYARGGVEYYSRILLRNRALRELLGNSGKRSYTEDGDIKHWIRRPERPFTERRGFCQSELNKHVEQRLNPTVQSAEKKLKPEPGSERRKISPFFTNVSTGQPVLGLKGASMLEATTGGGASSEVNLKETTNP